MNEYVFKQVKGNYPNINVVNNELIYNGKRIDLSKISLQEILSRPNVKTLEESNFVHLIELEVLAHEKIQEEQEALQKLSENNPTIKNLALVSLEHNGEMKKYVHYIDDMGTDHILYNFLPADVLSVYKNLLETNGGKVTEKDLYDALQRKMYEVNLEASYKAGEKTEQFDQEIAYHEKSVNQNGSYAKKNDEHELLISNHKIYSTYQDKNGNLYRNMNSMSDNQENLSKEEMTSSSVKEEEKEESMVLSLSEKEFYELLSLDRAYTEEEMLEMNLYYAFLYDIMVYQDYVSEEVLLFLNHYNQVMESFKLIEQNGVLNENQQTALQKREEMYEKLETQDRTFKKEEVLRLTKTLPKAGYITSGMIAFITAFLGYLLALGFLLLHK